MWENGIGTWNLIREYCSQCSLQHQKLHLACCNLYSNRSPYIACSFNRLVHLLEKGLGPLLTQVQGTQVTWHSKTAQHGIHFVSDNIDQANLQNEQAIEHKILTSKAHPRHKLTWSHLERWRGPRVCCITASI